MKEHKNANDEYYEHPLLSLKNTTDKGVGRAKSVVKISSRETSEFKRKAARKERRLVRQALKGNRIKSKTRPGDSWSLY